MSSVKIAAIVLIVAGVLGLAVGGYALAWFLVNDRVKLAAYRIFDPTERRYWPGNGSLLHREDESHE